MKRLSLTGCLCLMCCACSHGTQVEQEPAEGADSARWVFDRRLERLQSRYGQSAVEDMVREELREGLFSADRRSWYFMMFDHLEREGTSASLPILERWLSADLRDKPLGWPEIRYTRSAASQAWYAIKYRQCRTREEKAALARSLVGVDSANPPLDLSRDAVSEALAEFLPDSRVWVYDLLRGNTSLKEGASGTTVVGSLLLDAEFAPSREEAAAIMIGGGELGRYIMAGVLWRTDADAVRQYWMDALSNANNLYLAWLAVLHVRWWPWPKDERLLATLTASLGRLLKEPISEERERLKSALLAQLSFMTRDWPEIRERVADLCHRFLAEQPELGWADVLGFEGKPGLFSSSAHVGVKYYRVEARKTANAILEYLEAPATPSRGKAEDAQDAGAKAAELRDTGDRPTPSALGTQDANARFLLEDKKVH